MRSWLLKEKRRMVAAGVLVAALPLLGLAVFVHLSVSGALEEWVIKETGWFSAIAARIVEDELEAEIRHGEAYAARPYLQEGTRRRDRREMHRHLKELVERSPMLDRVFITDPGGIQLASYPHTPATVGKDFSGRDWYRGVSQSWMPYVSEIYQWAAEPRLLVFAIALPMLSDGSVVGILVLQPKPEFLVQAAGAIDLGRGRIHVLDKNGRSLHPLTTAQDAISDDPAVQRVMRGETGIIKRPCAETGEMEFAAYRPVGTLGLSVIVDKPESVVLGPVRRITAWLFAVTGLMAVAGGIFAFKGTKMLLENRSLTEERDRIFNLSLDMLCVAGFDGRFRQLNPSWETTLGWTREELRARPFLDFVHPEDREGTVAAMSVLAEGRVVRDFDNRYECRDGSFRWLSWTSHPLTEEKLIFAVARDITGRKSMERELSNRTRRLEEANNQLRSLHEEQQALNEELYAANEELQAQQEKLSEANRMLQQASRAKSDFLANMSHELRTPLNSVIGFSALLQEELSGPLSEQQREYVDYIAGSGQHLLSLINDVLDLSKVEAGKMELALSRFRIADLLQASLRMFREKAGKEGIRLELDVQPEADVEIEADERKLKQVMFNLLSNAVKFTPKGGEVLMRARMSAECGPGPADCSSSRSSPQRDEGTDSSELRTRHSPLHGSFVEISVSDTGIGIHQEDMGRLFSVFTQLEPSLTKKSTGTGLGLALSRKLVELHGGDIWAESEHGRGSVFTLRVPLRAGRADAAPAPAARKRPAAAGMHALVIDDDQQARELMREALSRDGYGVSTAASGNEGLAIAVRERPGIIIVDLMMPDMSGFETVERLRQEPSLAGVPVIVATAIDIDAEVKSRLAGKVQATVEKGSLSREAFIRVVKKVLGAAPAAEG